MDAATQTRDLAMDAPAAFHAASGSGFYRAYVEVLQGNRVMSDFIAAAGLGLTGVGVRETMTIDYKPGEEVDAARVSKAMDSMIEASNCERTDFNILSYKVLGVTLIPNAAGERPESAEKNL